MYEKKGQKKCLGTDADAGSLKSSKHTEEVGSRHIGKALTVTAIALISETMTTLYIDSVSKHQKAWGRPGERCRPETTYVTENLL